ncbi:MAG: PRTRC system ThiF family protein [Anaerolineaceae bacterium]
MADKFNLDYANGLKLLLPDANQIGLTLVGCGGTGSWLAPAVARIGKMLIDRWHKDVSIFFVDPDRVEEKNIYRQNFCQAEIGRNKAETLAARFGHAWGLEIQAEAERFGSISHNELSVIIGCVDNSAARKKIRDVTGDYRVWWLDSGNEKNAGQVLLGREICEREPRKNIFKFEGYCTWLPSPAKQHPELVENTTLEDLRADVNGLSCAEMAMQNSQGLSINQRMAAEAADFLARMLITKDLKRYATYIDLESGASRSSYITQKEIGRWCR